MDFRDLTWRGPRRPLSLSLIFASSLLVGCMTSESPETMDPDPEGERISEPSMLAGSTSSTNWPVELGHDVRVSVMGSANSRLVLHFRKAKAFSSGYDTVAISGMIQIFDGSSIPAVSPPDFKELRFESVDSVEIPIPLMNSLHPRGQDTVSVSMLLLVDSLRCFIPGVVYRRSTAEYIRSPFDENDPNAFTLSFPKYRFEGMLDTVGSSRLLSSGSKIQLSFYIPGSPYYWRPESFESLSLGPLSEGPFPLRLLLAVPEGSGTRVEIHEVIATKRIPGINGQPTKPPMLRIGTLIHSRAMVAPVTLRSAGP